MDIITRPARIEEFEELAAIEIDAFETLRLTGAVSGEPDSTDPGEMRLWLDEGILLVLAGENDKLVGFVGAAIADDILHICEMSIARAWQRKGFGRRLMLAILAEARQRNLTGATLTTDRLAPFNAPFYASLGFRILETSKLPKHLHGTLAREYAAGFDPARRVGMRLSWD